MKILELRNVQKEYESFHLHVDLDLNKGETIGFVGPNGAGKSTTLGLILNIVKKDAGEIIVFGKDHIHYEAEIKERIGVVLEEQNFYRKTRINYLLKFCASLYPLWDWEFTKYLLLKFAMTKNKKYFELSKGMKVKLALIIALSSGSELLIFDEPTSGLDPQMRHSIIEEIMKMKEKKEVSIIFSSHNMNDIETLADRIVLIHEGRIIFDEKKELLLKKWKRIEGTCRIDEAALTEEKNIISVTKSGNDFKLITNNFTEQLVERMMEKVATNIRVFDLELEDIFLCCTQKEVNNGIHKRSL